MNPNQRQVKTNAFSNKRSTYKVVNDPTNIVGVGKAGSIITMTGWINGEKQKDGNGVWFTDGTGWYWSGGFTNASTSGIVDVNPKPVPVPDPVPVSVAEIVAAATLDIRADISKLSASVAGIKVPTAGEIAAAVRANIIAPE